MSGDLATWRRILKADFDAVPEPERARVSEELMRAASAAAGTVATQPIPFIDILLISPIQIAMVHSIGRVRGYRLDRKSAFEIWKALRASLLSQQLIREAARAVPVAGEVVSVSVAYAVTYALGEVADYYFRTGRVTAAEELKAMFDRIYSQKRAERAQPKSGPA